MEEQGKFEKREDIFSQAVRAGKRTYFFDVKETRNGQQYLTITESKKRFNSEDGKFFYEKHKIFLYHEDFEKFSKGLATAIEFIETGEKPEEEKESVASNPIETTTDVSFEDLGNEEDKGVAE
jgi:hypothetical protein